MLGYNFTPVGMYSIEKTRANKYWRRCGEKENFSTVGGIVN